MDGIGYVSVHGALDIGWTGCSIGCQLDSATRRKGTRLMLALVEKRLSAPFDGQLRVIQSFQRTLL